MNTPGWVRRRRRLEHAETTAIRAELHVQALERITVEDDDPVEEWIPRRGMQFASERTAVLDDISDSLTATRRGVTR